MKSYNLPLNATKTENDDGTVTAVFCDVTKEQSDAYLQSLKSIYDDTSKPMEERQKASVAYLAESRYAQQAGYSAEQRGAYHTEGTTKSGETKSAEDAYPSLATPPVFGNGSWLAMGVAMASTIGLTCKELAKADITGEMLVQQAFPLMTMFAASSFIGIVPYAVQYASYRIMKAVYKKQAVEDIVMESLDCLKDVPKEKFFTSEKDRHILTMYGDFRKKPDWLSYTLYYAVTPLILSGILLNSVWTLGDAVQKVQKNIQTVVTNVVPPFEQREAKTEKKTVPLFDGPS